MHSNEVEGATQTLNGSVFEFTGDSIVLRGRFVYVNRFRAVAVEHCYSWRLYRLETRVGDVWESGWLSKGSCAERRRLVHLSPRGT